MPFNPLIAVDLSWTDAFADFRTETFTRCWNEHVHCGLDELAMEGCRLGGDQLRMLAREVAASPSFLEDILGYYFDELVSGGELPARGVDATEWAMGVADHLLGEERLWETRVEIYRYTWKIKRLYTDTSATSLAPLFQSFDRTVPAWTCVSDIYLHLSTIDDLDEISIPEWLVDHRITPSVANVRYVNFLLYNDLRFVSSADTQFKYLRLNSILDNFESASSHFDFDGCVEASGLGLREGIAPSSVKLRVLSHSIIDQFRPARACDEADRDELTFKAFLRSKEHGQLVQGIPIATHRLIVETLRELGRIISLRDIRRVTGASRIRFDPFQLEPGPVVVYAPGDRYLQGDAVSFALREWVQDEAHRRGRVAVDRILTPLQPCPIATPLKISEACMTSSQAFRRTGVVFLHEACSLLKPRTDKQAQRWATERTRRAVDTCLRKSGLIRMGEAYFNKAAWDLQDANRLTPKGIRDRILNCLKSGRAPNAALESPEMIDRIILECER